MPIAQYVTDFADQAVVLPLTLCVFIGLLLGGWRRGASAWLFSICAVLGTMLILKLFFAACGHMLPFRIIHSPSGHTAAAEVAYGGLAALFLRRVGGAALAIAGAVFFAVLIGATRLILGVHTLPEVLLASVIGLSGILLLLPLSGPMPDRLRWNRLGLVALVVVMGLHGFRLGAEPAIDRWALMYLWPLSVCSPSGETQA